MIRKAPVHLLAIVLIGCTKESGTDDTLADETSDGETSESETGDSETGDGDSETATDEIGDDADDDTGTDDNTSGETSGEDCELGEYISQPINPLIDWSQASGAVNHGVSRGVFESIHGVHAIFVANAGEDDSQLCVEWLVGNAELGIDACNVHYTQGFGKGGEWPQPGFDDLAVDAVTFDVGEGPIALETWPGDNLNPAQHSGSFDPPPEGVPFGGTATLAVNFSELPDLDLDLDVPEDLMPISPAHGSTTLSSAALASWTWSSPGGAEPVELEIIVGATPWGSGWSELVRIRCLATDDGEFAFPVEYFDLARDELGPEIHAGATITRRTRGQVPLAGEDLYWFSSNDVMLGVEIVD